MQKATSFNNAAVIYVKRNAYRIHFWYISKNDASNIMNGSNLADKMGVLTFFLLYIKMSENTDLTYYKKKQRDVVLNRAKDYYKNKRD